MKISFTIKQKVMTIKLLFHKTSTEKKSTNLSYSPTKETIAITKTIKKGDIYSSDYLYGPTTVYDIKQTADRYTIITSGHPILVDFGTTSVKVTYNKDSFEIPYSELSFGESFPSEEN
jgi:hypothetical protein